jgi:predicted XRE-type DNA-binding protein
MPEKKSVVAVRPTNESLKQEKYLEETEHAENLWEDWPEEVKEKVLLNKAAAKELLRRKSAMKIIKLLYKRNEPLKQKEIYEGLEIYRQLAQHNLKRLIKAGVVRVVNTDVVDATARYYELSMDRALAAKLVKRFDSIVGSKKT